MISAGIDIGSRSIECVVLEDGNIKEKYETRIVKKTSADCRTKPY